MGFGENDAWRNDPHCPADHVMGMVAFDGHFLVNGKVPMLKTSTPLFEVFRATPPLDVWIDGRSTQPIAGAGFGATGTMSGPRLMELAAQVQFGGRIATRAFGTPATTPRMSEVGRSKCFEVLRHQLGIKKKHLTDEGFFNAKLPNPESRADTIFLLGPPPGYKSRDLLVGSCDLFGFLGQGSTAVVHLAHFDGGETAAVKIFHEFAGAPNSMGPHDPLWTTPCEAKRSAIHRATEEQKVLTLLRRAVKTAPLTIPAVAQVAWAPVDGSEGREESPILMLEHLPGRDLWALLQDNRVSKKVKKELVARYEAMLVALKADLEAAFGPATGELVQNVFRTETGEKPKIQIKPPSWQFEVDGMKFWLKPKPNNIVVDPKTLHFGLIDSF